MVRSGGTERACRSVGPTSGASDAADGRPDAKQLRRREIHKASAKRMRDKRARELQDAKATVEQLQANTRRLEDEADKAHRRLSNVTLMVRRWQKLAVQERQQREDLTKTLQALQAKAHAREQQASAHSITPHGWALPRAPSPQLPACQASPALQPQDSFGAYDSLAVVPTSFLDSPQARPGPAPVPPSLLPDPNLLKSFDLVHPSPASSLGFPDFCGPVSSAGTPSPLHSLSHAWDLLDQPVLDVLDAANVPEVPELPAFFHPVGSPVPSRLQAPSTTTRQVPFHSALTQQHQQQSVLRAAPYLPRHSQGCAWLQPASLPLLPLALAPAVAAGVDLPSMSTPDPSDLAFRSSDAAAAAASAGSLPGLAAYFPGF